MRIVNLLKIALVTPPLSGHLTRGTGTYFYNLYESLKEDKSISVSLINLTDPGTEFDLIHYPYFDPFFITMPLLGNLGKVPSIVTVHDLIPLKYPDKFPIGIRGLFKWQIQRSSLVRSSMIITDSVASKKDIIKIIGVKESKISVIYLGVNPVFKKIENQNILSETSKKFNLPDKFILNVGDVNYNKNVKGIIESFLPLAKESADLHLVLVGRGFTDESAQLEEIKSMINKYELNKNVIRLSGLDIKELISLYSLASVYIHPSFDEGFGLPLLEAFACELPVVSSSSGSLPEVAGKAALLVDPQNTNGITQNVRSLLVDSSLRHKLVAEGSLQAKKFSWTKTRDETIDLYQKVLGINKFQLK